jgi:peptide/nickel transport system ATP-binding protein
VDDTILSVKGLSIHYPTSGGVVKAVDNVDFAMPRGSVVGLVGESGCGKSTLGLAILKLMRPPGEIVSGKIVLDGEDLIKKDEGEMRRVRGAKVSMIFQDPMTSLNPLIRLDRHFLETIRAHEKGVSTEERLKEFPHELSGGMRQRIMIGLSLILNPELIIADEPTNSLDVIVEAHFLELLKRLQKEYRLTILLITHNMGIVAQLADRVAVMYAGRIIEEGKVVDLFDEPLHPYTRGLLSSIPNIRIDQMHLYTMPGSPPDLTDLPPGCAFHPRCPERMDVCDKKRPVGIRSDGRAVECFLYGGRKR